MASDQKRSAQPKRDQAVDRRPQRAERPGRERAAERATSDRASRREKRG